MSIEAFRQQLETLAADYRRTLPRKLDEIELLWRELAAGAGSARLKELERALHTLAGTAKTMGAPGVSEAAAAAESFIAPYGRRGKLPPVAQRDRFEKLLQALRLAAPAP